MNYMKSVWTVLAIVLLLAGIYLFYRALVKRHVYKNVRDGRAGFQKKKKKQAKLFLIVGIALCLAGAAMLLFLRLI